jgi:hypothetical protein
LDAEWVVGEMGVWVGGGMGGYGWVEEWVDTWAEGWIKTKGFIKTKSLKGGVWV